MSRGTDAAMRALPRTSKGVRFPGESVTRGIVPINVRGELEYGRAFFGTETERFSHSP